MHIPEEGHTQKTREEEVDPGSRALFNLFFNRYQVLLLAKTSLHFLTMITKNKKSPYKSWIGKTLSQLAKIKKKKDFLQAPTKKDRT